MNVAAIKNQITDKCLEAFAENQHISIIALAHAIMDMPDNIMHNPSHHYLVPAVLLTAYHQAAGSDRSVLQKQLNEAFKRSDIVPGAVCGTHGCCGAAVGVGIFFSLVTKNTPYSTETWGQANRATAETLLSMADYGGPRCCKRCSYISLLKGVELAQKELGIALEIEMPLCHYYAENKECLHHRCPYFPPKKV
jgi:hypothetical protein